MPVVVERRTDEPAPPPAMLPKLEETRCRQCSRLLCKTTREAVRPGQMIEIKCNSCNTLNFLVGRPDL
jgi:phage FluMu protein Com